MPVAREADWNRGQSYGGSGAYPGPQFSSVEFDPWIVDEEVDYQEDGEDVYSTPSSNVEDQFAVIKMGFANDLQSEELAGCEHEKEKLSVKEALLTQACARSVDIAEATMRLSTIKASCGVPSTDALFAKKTKSDSSKRCFILDSNLKEGPTYRSCTRR